MMKQFCIFFACTILGCVCGGAFLMAMPWVFEAMDASSRQAKCYFRPADNCPDTVKR